MCGIVGGVAERNTVPILLEGLRRLEYRGYDSAGVAVLTRERQLDCVRSVGKVAALAENLERRSFSGSTGIAHTRWATHGRPSEENAHPHISCDSVAVVHNGIIENAQELRDRLTAQDYEFRSETDTEAIAHLIESHLRQTGDLLQAVQRAVTELDGAFALGVVCAREPDRMIAARRGSPLVIGVGLGEHFIASDVLALLPVTHNFMFLEDGDIADLHRDRVTVLGENGQPVERPITQSRFSGAAADRGGYRHHMLKEIFEQPTAIAETLEGRIHHGRVLEEAFGHDAPAVFDQVRGVHIVACGTSYHAGLVARYWLEELGIPCAVEVASEFRYRPRVVPPDTLFVTLSQSGETADTMAALREAAKSGYVATLGICNVPESSLVREADLTLMTRAGPEIGVASTKAFTTQLVALRLLSLVLGRRGGMTEEQEAASIRALEDLPRMIDECLHLNDAIEALADRFVEKSHALFLGRGAHYPIAREGALKLKEISYIHAEAYPAGELKHGPLALVDTDMPIVSLMPADDLRGKMASSLQEVRARGGEVFAFVDDRIEGLEQIADHSVRAGAPEPSVSPIVFSVPLQLLAYHVAILKGTDVDQPRNLAKSVTVE